jgi:hypothetical protein
MGAILMVVGFAIIVGIIVAGCCLMMRIVMREERERFERRLEAWRAGGSVGPEPIIHRPNGGEGIRWGGFGPG